MFNYDNLNKTALRLIQRFGRPLTLRRGTKGGYDPVTNTRTEGTALLVTVFGVFGEYKEFQIDGTNIQRGDKVLMIAAKGLAIEPTPSDYVVDGEIVLKIVNVQIEEPGDTALYYRLQVRR